MENRYDELCEMYEEQFNPDNDFSAIENDTTHLGVFADWMEEIDDELAEYLRILIGWMIKEKLSLEKAISFEELLSEIEDNHHDRDHFLAYADHIGITYASLEDFEDKYQGEWESLADYVEDWFDQTGEYKKSDNWWHPSNYTDWERMGADLELSGDIFTVELKSGSILVFYNH